MQQCAVDFGREGRGDEQRCKDGGMTTVCRRLRLEIDVSEESMASKGRTLHSGYGKGRRHTRLIHWNLDMLHIKLRNNLQVLTCWGVPGNAQYPAGR